MHLGISGEPQTLSSHQKLGSQTLAKTIENKNYVENCENIKMFN